jgi:hypothetical protein
MDQGLDGDHAFTGLEPVRSAIRRAKPRPRLAAAGVQRIDDLG